MMVLSLDDVKQIMAVFGEYKIRESFEQSRGKSTDLEFSYEKWITILESGKISINLEGRIKDHLKSLIRSLAKWWKFIKSSFIKSRAWNMGIEEIIRMSQSFEDWEYLVKFLISVDLKKSEFFNMAIIGLLRVASKRQLVIVANLAYSNSGAQKLALQELDNSNFTFFDWVDLIKNNKDVRPAIFDFMLCQIQKTAKNEKNSSRLLDTFWRLYKEALADSSLFDINMKILIVISKKILKTDLDLQALGWMKPMLKIEDSFKELKFLVWRKCIDILRYKGPSSSDREYFLTLAIKENIEIIFDQIHLELHKDMRSYSDCSCSFRFLFFLYRVGFYDAEENLIDRLLESCTKSNNPINKFKNSHRLQRNPNISNQEIEEVKFKYYFYLLKIAVKRQKNNEIRAIINKIKNSNYTSIFYFNSIIEMLSILPEDAKEERRSLEQEIVW
jgi:hypothetical protein